MKIKVEWQRETRGVTEVEVNPDEVAQWLNDSGFRNTPVTPEEVTPDLAYDFLRSGDDEEWAGWIDFERDNTPLPWNEYELERLVKE